MKTRSLSNEFYPHVDLIRKMEVDILQE